MTVTPKQARKFIDLSQQDVADKLGVHRQTYMKWERNPDEMPVGVAKEFSKIVGRGVDEIFFTTMST